MSFNRVSGKCQFNIYRILMSTQVGISAECSLLYSGNKEGVWHP
jgi:hypothetical protein